MKMILSRLCKTLLLSSALVAQSAFALQILDAVEGKTLYAKISAKEPSRVSLEGGKLRKLMFDATELQVEPDISTGQAFIRPLVFDKPINIFAIAESGATYTLLLQSVDIPAENVILRDLNRKAANVPPVERQGDYEKTIRSMIVGMASGQTPEGIEFEAAQQEYALWEGSRLILTGRYTGRSVIGERFKLINTGTEVMRLAEQELYRKGVAAVAIEHLNLNPAQATDVYVVRTTASGN